MPKPIIGIAANKLIVPNELFFFEPVTYTPQGFVSAVQKVGGLPIVLPVDAPEAAADYIASVDKLLLAGGQDVTPLLYGEEPDIRLKATYYERDLFEKALIEEAIKQKKPIFSACRGTQLVNAVLGGTLYQDLASYDNWQVKHDMAPTMPKYAFHSITVKKDSVLAELIGTTAQVNSYHHQAIKTVSPRLTVIAQAADGVVEAVCGKDFNYLGVQWHPELTYADYVAELALFDFFVNRQ